MSGRLNWQAQQRRKVLKLWLTRCSGASDHQPPKSDQYSRTSSMYIKGIAPRTALYFTEVIGCVSVSKCSWARRRSAPSRVTSFTLQINMIIWYTLSALISKWIVSIARVRLQLLFGTIPPPAHDLSRHPDLADTSMQYYTALKRYSDWLPFGTKASRRWSCHRE